MEIFPCSDLEAKVEEELERERTAETRRQKAREGVMLEKIDENARREAERVKKMTDLSEEERSRQLDEIMAIQKKQTDELKVRCDQVSWCVFILLEANAQS